METKPNWTSLSEASETTPGGKICIAPGKYVDAFGRSLDADFREKELKAQIAAAQAQLDALKPKEETPKEAMPTAVDKPKPEEDPKPEDKKGK